MGRARILEVLRSGRTALLLFFATATLAAAGTLYTPAQGRGFLAAVGGKRVLDAAEAIGLIDVYRGPLFLSLLGLIVVNVVLCTWHRLRLRRAVSAGKGGGARRGLLVLLDAGMHLSILLVLAGAAAKLIFGFVGTKNMYVGVPEDEVYDWRSETDVPLGFDILVGGVEMTHFPAVAQIGVSESATSRKIELLTVREGGRGALSDESLQLRDVRFDAGSASFEMLADLGGQARRVRLPFGSGTRSEASVGPYTLTLVAWRRDVRGVSGRVAIRASGQTVREGRLEVNGRLRHQGWNLYLTGWGRDQFGNDYAGIQVTREPGSVLFWAGSVLFSACLPAFLYLRHRGRGPNGQPRPSEG